MEQDPIKVLIIDDDPVRDDLQIYLEEEFGFSSDTAANGQEALELATANLGVYDVAIIDQGLIPKPDGITVMRELKALDPDIECIIFTGKGIEEREKALREGAFRYVEKNLEEYTELALLIRTAVQQARLRTIGLEIVSKRRREIILPYISSVAKQLSLADISAIVLQNEQSGSLDLFSSTGDLPTDCEAELLINRILSKRIIDSGKTICKPDIALRQDAQSMLVDKLGIQSLVGIPIPGKRGNLGVLYALSREPNHFEAWGTIGVLQTIAGQAGVAIANAEAYEHEEAQARYMTALAKTGRVLTVTSDPEEMFHLAWEFVRKHLEATTFFIGLYDSETELVHFPLSYDEGVRQPVFEMDLRDPNNRSITAHVIRSRQPYYWPTSAARLEACRSLNVVSKQVGDKSCESCFYFPSMSGAQFITVISIQAYRGYAFSEAQLNAMESLGNLLAASLNNANLLGKVKRHAENLDTMQELVRAMTSKLNENEVMELLCKTAVEFFQADHSGLVVFDETYSYGTVKAEFPSNIGTLGKRIPVAGVIDEERLISQKQPLHIPSSRNRSTFDPVSSMVVKEFGIESLVIAPVIIDEVVIGSFSIDSIRRQRNFSKQEIELCVMFASHAAIAIKNARLYEAERKQSIQLATMQDAVRDFAESTEIKDTLERIVKNARIVLGTETAILWPYDDQREKFIPDEITVLGGISAEEIINIPGLETKSAEILNEGYLTIENRDLHLLDEPMKMLCKKFGGGNIQGVSLNVGDNSIGVLFLCFKSHCRFGREAEAITRTFASHAALALKTARLLEQLWRTQKAAEIVAKDVVSQPLVNTLETITKSVREILNADIATIYAYDVERQRFYEGACSGDLQNPSSFQQAQDLTIITSAPYRIIDLESEPYYEVAEDRVEDNDVLYGHYCKVEKVRASIGYQLRVNNKKSGVMFINFRRKHHRFTEDELSIVRLFADEAAIAIQNAQLYKQSENRAAQLETVAKIGREVSSNLNLADFLEGLFGQLKNHFEEREIPVYPILGAYDEEKDSLIMFPTRYYPAPISPKIIPVSNRSIMTWTINHKQAYYAPDVSKDGNYFKFLDKTRSELAVPVFFGERLMGVLDLESPILDAFKSEDRNLLRLVADQIASAWNSLQQYEELRQTEMQVGARTALAWIGMISTIYLHEMKGSASKIQDRLELLRADLGLQIPSGVEEHIGRIELIANRIFDIPLTAPLSPDDGVESVSIAKVLRQRLDQLISTRERLKDIEFKIIESETEDYKIRMHPEWLTRIFELLIMNSADAMSGSVNKKVIIRFVKNEDRVETYVDDNGPGIPEEVLSKLFKGPIKGTKGLGIGLMMAQVIAQTYGGDIDVDRDFTGSDGTRMVFWFPAEMG